MEPICKIRVFDDGNQKYQYVQNEWIITAITAGKASLKNINGVDIISSISYWKLDLILTEEGSRE